MYRFRKQFVRIEFAEIGLVRKHNTIPVLSSYQSGEVVCNQELILETARTVRKRHLESLERYYTRRKDYSSKVGKDKRRRR